MSYNSVPDIQQNALAQLNQFRYDAISEVTGVIPLYAGPWEIAAQDLSRFMADDHEAHGLVVYEHGDEQDAFRSYLDKKITALVSVATPERMKQDTAIRHFDYVVGAESAIKAVRNDISARFLLKLTTERPDKLRPNQLILPTYDEAGGPQLEWTPEDSVRLYKELYFANGGPVTEDTFEALAKRGEGPYLKRILKGMSGILELRERAELDEIIYHRYLTVEQKVEFLSNLGTLLGREPTFADIELANGPSYKALVRGVGIGALRAMVKGEIPVPEAEPAKEWTAQDSADLFKQLCDEHNDGKALTQKQLRALLSSTPNRPHMKALLLPFQEGGAPEEAFGRMERQAGFFPSVGYNTDDVVKYLQQLAEQLGHFPSASEIRAAEGPGFNRLTKEKKLSELRGLSGY